MSLVIRHKIITAITVILFVVVVMPVGVQAATQSECNADKNELTLGLPKWYKYLEVTPENGGGRCSPQVDDFSAVLPVGLAVLEGLLRFAGIIAVGMIFVGAFKFILSQGNPDSAKGARQTIINALIGLVIVIVSTSLVTFIGSSFISPSTTMNESPQALMEHIA
jgi:hypothetical protein